MIKVIYFVYGIYIYVLLQKSFSTPCLQINVSTLSFKTSVGLFFKVHKFDSPGPYFHVRN